MRIPPLRQIVSRRGGTGARLVMVRLSRRSREWLDESILETCVDGHNGEGLLLERAIVLRGAKDEDLAEPKGRVAECRFNVWPDAANEVVAVTMSWLDNGPDAEADDNDNESPIYKAATLATLLVSALLFRLWSIQGTSESKR